MRNPLRVVSAFVPALAGWSLCLISRGAPAADWPRFRGPSRSGVSEGRGLPVEVGPGGKNSGSRR